ncbi:hypothetical protein [Ilumatobacter sp.]|uniref:hypothetical protein n=1 Tax=Ilumatobacter sp. TaxID=1967498 RepID=UPI003752A49A
MAEADREDLLVEIVTAVAVPTVAETTVAETAAVVVAMTPEVVVATNVAAAQVVVMIDSRKTVHH